MEVDILGYREKRIEAGYTQEAVAKLLGISNSSVCLYEKGRTDPPVETLHKMAVLYRCTLDELMKGEGRKK